MRRESRTILLTGAASGIGRACALELARRGDRLGLVDRDRDGLEAVAAEARAFGAPVTTFVVDLAKADEIDRLAADAAEALGPIDVLFNNAGVAVIKPLDLTRDDDWRWLFDVNVWAPIRLTRALVPAMAARGRGQIVMTASLAGLMGAPGMVAYSTSKFALVGFSESLRAELAPHGIDITVICPGYIKTGLHRATRYDNATFEAFVESPPDWYGVPIDQAARSIVRAIDRRDPQLVLGIERASWYLKRLSPALSFAVASFAARRLGLVGGKAPKRELPAWTPRWAARGLSWLAPDGGAR